MAQASSDSFFPEREAVVLDVYSAASAPSGADVSECVSRISAVVSTAAARVRARARARAAAPPRARASALHHRTPFHARHLQLDRYQEQPQLLDRDFPAIVGPVMQRMREELRLLPLRAGTATAAAAAAAAAAPAASAAAEAPPPPPHAYLCQLASIVYRTTKLRGYKSIIKLFPHAVADVEPVLDALLQLVRRLAAARRLGCSLCSLALTRRARPFPPARPSLRPPCRRRRASRARGSCASCCCCGCPSSC